MASERSSRAFALLDEYGVDAILVTNGTNRRYLTDFSGDDHAIDEPAGIAIVGKDSLWLLTPSTNMPWASSEANADTTVLNWGTGWIPTVVGLARDQGWKNIGFEDSTTTVASYNALGELAGDITLKPVGNAVDTIRAIKTAEEIDLIRTVLHMTDVAFEAASARATAGMTEKQLAEIVAEELKRAGSDGEGFPTIVASGPNAAKPHHAPGDRVMQEGEPIIIDMGGLHKGYSGDLTRTLWFGEPSSELVTMYRNVQAAFDASIGAAKPGMTGVEFDAIARDVFVQQGTDQFFIHSLGHGLGLRVHESPSASSRSKDTFAAGMVVTVEPGLYVPDQGGVRIEDVVLITENGVENLTRAPKTIL